MKIRTTFWRIAIPFVLLVLVTVLGVSGYVTQYLRANSIQILEDDLVRLQRTIWGFGAVVGVLGVAIAAWVSGRITRRLGQLSETANRNTGDDSRNRFLVRGDDEVADLARALDDMLQHMNRRIDALETERVTLGAVLSQMSDGVVLVAADGTVMLVNESAEKLFGVSKEEVEGKSVVRALGYYQLVDLWQQSRDTNEEQAMSFEMALKTKFVHAIATPLGEASGGETLLLFQDLTRSKQVENLRRDFISNISHELRTPLASLKALAETLQTRAFDDASAARRFLDMMGTEIDALSHLVSELLELARIESGRVALQLEPIAPCDLITHAGERLRLQAERAGLDLRVECPGDLPPVVADAERLEQVLANLIQNAVKFTPKGGVISVSADHEDGRVRIWVKDTGVGISSEDLPRIFERFYKADQARSKGGTGLGLAIAKHLVERHGGRIWAESQEGQGSTFFLTLPVAPGAVSQLTQL